MAQVATAEILLFSWIFTIIVVQEVEKFEHPLGRHTGFVPDNYVESFKSVSNYVDLFIYSFDEGRFMFYSPLFDSAISQSSVRALSLVDKLRSSTPASQSDTIWSLKVYNIQRAVTKPNEPVICYLSDELKRGFVCEELLVVSPNTPLKAHGYRTRINAHAH